MNFIDFKNHFKNFVVFSVNDIKKIEPDFYLDRLTDWQKQGYIKKIIRNYYIFADLELNQELICIIANKIYQPSYISLEMALSYYHLIPEGVFSFTSVSSLKTTTLRTSVGTCTYRKIKPKLFWGYDLIQTTASIPYKMAQLEKAILDYFYLNPHLKTDEDFYELRINDHELRDILHREKLLAYLEIFDNKALKKRIDKFLKFIYAQS